MTPEEKKRKVRTLALFLSCASMLNPEAKKAAREVMEPTELAEDILQSIDPSWADDGSDPGAKDTEDE
jgi:hypothetical protein